jgi:hypothetical protein
LWTRRATCDHSSGVTEGISVDWVFTLRFLIVDEVLRTDTCRLARHAALRWHVAQKLALEWSPAQIAGWLATAAVRGQE